MASVPSPAPTRQSAAAFPLGLSLTIDVLRAWANGDAVAGAADPNTGRAAAALLAQNRLLGLTGDLLLTAAPDGQVSDTIVAFRRLTAEMNGASLLLMRRLSVLLAKLPVDVVVYKGVVLQMDLYGTPFARPASDVDLLTASANYKRVARTLEAEGYRLDPHTDTLWWRRFLAEQQFRRADDAQSIDLHHRIQQPGCPMPRRPARLIASAVPQRFLGGEVLTFRPDHALLVAAMSLAKALHHREPAGRYVGDVERMLRRLTPETWSAIREEAETLGLGRTLDLAVRCVDAVFGPFERPPGRAILADISDGDLQAMLLAPAQAVTWVRRRRLLRELCDRPTDAVSAWLVMAASETARRASAPRPILETAR
ncbi:MAG: nucleotidyltransferase family protein [Brevundimonas sp.]